MQPASAVFGQSILCLDMDVGLPCKTGRLPGHGSQGLAQDTGFSVKISVHIGPPSSYCTLPSALLQHAGGVKGIPMLNETTEIVSVT